MFTGIIEELGNVIDLNIQDNSAKLSLTGSTVLKNTNIGDSIAVNGVCLTITEMNNNSFTVDIMHETLEKTNLHELNKQSKVNLERALQLQTRLGGHIVSGHVDGTGSILSIKPIGIASIYKISASIDITSLLIPKGSVAIDGISLTVIDVDKNFFTVSLIPHTFKNTTLGIKSTGNTVNLETDLIGKYVAKFLNKDENTKKQDISLAFLTENGFI